MSASTHSAGDYEPILPGSLDRAHRYKLFTGTVIPRPIARGDKDTLVNIRREREFVINTVPAGLEHLVQRCGEDMPPEVSEIEATGLDLLPSVHVRAPRVAQSRVQFECRLERIIEVGNGPNHFVIGEVLLVHVEHGLHEDCRIDARRYDPMARIGGRNYVSLGEIVET